MENEEMEPICGKHEKHGQCDMVSGENQNLVGIEQTSRVGGLPAHEIPYLDEKGAVQDKREGDWSHRKCSVAQLEASGENKRRKAESTQEAYIETLTTRQVAKILGCSPKTMFNRAIRGDIRHKFRGRRIIFTYQHVREFIKNNPSLCVNTKWPRLSEGVLTTTKSAKYLGISRKLFKKLADEHGVFPDSATKGGMPLYLKSDIQALAINCEERCRGCAALADVIMETKAEGW